MFTAMDWADVETALIIELKDNPSGNFLIDNVLGFFKKVLRISVPRQQFEGAIDAAKIIQSALAATAVCNTLLFQYIMCSVSMPGWHH